VERPAPVKDKPAPNRPKQKKPPKQPKNQPKNQQKASPKPGKVEPFSALAKAASLPAIGEGAAAGEAMALGQVHLEPGAALDVQLLASDAVKSAPRFTLRAQANGDSKKEWLVSAAAADSDAAAATGVARIWLDQNTLDFQWLPGAGPAGADHLRNCGLLLSAGSVTHFLPLRQPREVQPLAINPDYGPGRNQRILKDELLPDAGAIFLQLDLEPPFPAHKMRAADPRIKPGPGNLIPLKGKVDVLLTDPKLPPFGIRIAFESRQRELLVGAMPMRKGPGPRGHGEIYLPLGPSYLRTAKDGLMRQQMTLKGSLTGQKDAAKKKATTEEIKKVEAQLAQVNALYDTLQKTPVHFRICVPVGEKYQVDLFTTHTAASQAKLAGK
jgi:hypothetical protein